MSAAGGRPRSKTYAAATRGGASDGAAGDAATRQHAEARVAHALRWSAGAQARALSAQAVRTSATMGFFASPAAAAAPLLLAAAVASSRGASAASMARGERVFGQKSDVSTVLTLASAGPARIRVRDMHALGGSALCARPLGAVRRARRAQSAGAGLAAAAPRRAPKTSRRLAAVAQSAPPDIPFEEEGVRARRAARRVAAAGRFLGRHAAACAPAPPARVETAAAPRRARLRACAARRRAPGAPRSLCRRAAAEPAAPNKALGWACCLPLCLACSAPAQLGRRSAPQRACPAGGAHAAPRPPPRAARESVRARPSGCARLAAAACTDARRAASPLPRCPDC